MIWETGFVPLLPHTYTFPRVSCCGWSVFPYSLISCCSLHILGKKHPWEKAMLCSSVCSDFSRAIIMNNSLNFNRSICLNNAYILLLIHGEEIIIVKCVGFKDIALWIHRTGMFICLVLVVCFFLSVFLMDLLLWKLQFTGSIDCIIKHAEWLRT